VLCTVTICSGLCRIFVLLRVGRVCIRGYRLPDTRLQTVVGLRAVGGVSLLDDPLDVFDEQRVKHVHNLFPLGHQEGPVKWNPYTLQVHRTDLDDVSRFLSFENAVSPPTGHLRHVQKLRSIYHVIVGPPDNSHAVGLHLVAQRLFVLPHYCGDFRPSTHRLHLAH